MEILSDGPCYWRWRAGSEAGSDRHLGGTGFWRQRSQGYKQRVEAKYKRGSVRQWQDDYRFVVLKPVLEEINLAAQIGYRHSSEGRGQDRLYRDSKDELTGTINMQHQKRYPIQYALRGE